MNYTGENIQAERELVAKALGGDPDACAVIISNSEKIVAQIVFKMIANHEDRRDIAQDVYLKAFGKLATFKFQAKLSTWIARIAYNTCFNYLSKKKLLLLENNEEEDGDDSDFHIGADNTANEIEEYLSEKDLKAILTIAIEKLPGIYRTLISLYHMEELSYDEISQITALPEGTIKSYLFRARKALKEDITTKLKREDL